MADCLRGRSLEHRRSLHASLISSNAFVRRDAFSFLRLIRRWPVVVGQYLGFSALIAIGLVEFSSGCVCRTSIAKIAIITGGRSLRATSPIHLS